MLNMIESNFKIMYILSLLDAEFVIHLILVERIYRKFYTKRLKDPQNIQFQENFSWDLNVISEVLKGA